MRHVTIHTTTMGFRVGVSKQGTLLGTGTHLREYVRRFEHWKYDRLDGSWQNAGEYYHFDVDNEMCYFPKFDLDRFKAFLTTNQITYTITEIPGEEGKHVNFLMLPFVSFKNDKQKNAVEFLTSPSTGPLRGLGLQTGTGKAQPLDAAILTPSGWRTMGDMQVGSEITAPDGTTTKVVGVYPQGVKQIYRVILGDGRKTECCREHLWLVNQEKVISLDEMIRNPGTYTVPVFHPESNKTTNTPIMIIEYVGEKEAQCIMVDHPEHLYVTDQYIVTHNTVAYIMALQKLARRSMTTMTSRLEQWVAELVKYTSLEEEDIYIIQGVASLTKLYDKIDKDIKPKIILASSKTIRLYLDYGPTYQHLPHPSKMCEKLGIGIIGTDEYHEHFYTNFKIGIIMNPAIFIPITATFVASDQFVKNIFDKFIPADIQFVGGEYDRYVNVTSYRYDGGGNMIKPYHYQGRQGYSQQMFEKFLMSKKGKPVLDALVNDAILPIIRTHYTSIAEEGEKFLFLCSSTALCDYLEGVFKRAFNKTVSVFYTGKPVTVLEKFDMILSTPGSAGTGRDIKNLRTCFAFENTASEIRNLQFIGRLRPYPAVKNTPEFTYISFSCIPQHLRYSQTRSLLYGNRAAKLTHRSIR